MSIRTHNERIIFGLKVKWARQQKNLSFASLSNQSGLSVSYLNEIEKGKKYPKQDKIDALAGALSISPEELMSLKLDKALRPVGDLLRSNFLNDIPLDLFGIDLAKVVEIIASAPTRVGAFISTLLELSRNYALNEESFYFGALRSYLQLHDNYFEDIELAVNQFNEKHQIPADRPIETALLESILKKEYQYQLEEGELNKIETLKNLRSLYLPTKKVLLLNSNLSKMQRSFQLGKELGFNFMGLKERAYTSSILKARSFEEVLNHSKAIYFSVALHLDQASVLDKIKGFFDQPTWSGEAFLNMIKTFDATPEMFYHRLTNLLPKFLGIKQLFFLRFSHSPLSDKFEIDRELHLNRRHQPHSNGLEERYCRRWVGISLLKDLRALQKEGKFVSQIAHVQRSRYLGTEDEYLCLTVARPAYPAPNQNVSVTIGLQVNARLKEVVKFLDDPAILRKDVGVTCERCALKNCEERAAEPSIIQKKSKLHAILNKFEELDNRPT